MTMWCPELFDTSAFVAVQPVCKRVAADLTPFMQQHMLLPCHERHGPHMRDVARRALQLTGSLTGELAAAAAEEEGSDDDDDAEALAYRGITPANGLRKGLTKPFLVGWDLRIAFAHAAHRPTQAVTMHAHTIFTDEYAEAWEAELCALSSMQSLYFSMRSTIRDVCLQYTLRHACAFVTTLRRMIAPSDVIARLTWDKHLKDSVAARGMFLDMTLGGQASNLHTAMMTDYNILAEPCMQEALKTAFEHLWQRTHVDDRATLADNAFIAMWHACPPSHALNVLRHDTQTLARVMVHAHRLGKPSSWCHRSWPELFSTLLNATQTDPSGRAAVALAVTHWRQEEAGVHGLPLLQWLHIMSPASRLTTSPQPLLHLLQHKAPTLAHLAGAPLELSVGCLITIPHLQQLLEAHPDGVFRVKQMDLATLLSPPWHSYYTVSNPQMLWQCSLDGVPPARDVQLFEAAITWCRARFPEASWQPTDKDFDVAFTTSLAQMHSLDYMNFGAMRVFGMLTRMFSREWARARRRVHWLQTLLVCAEMTSMHSTVPCIVVWLQRRAPLRTPKKATHGIWQQLRNMCDTAPAQVVAVDCCVAVASLLRDEGQWAGMETVGAGAGDSQAWRAWCALCRKWRCQRGGRTAFSALLRKLDAHARDMLCRCAPAQHRCVCNVLSFQHDIIK